MIYFTSDLHFCHNREFLYKPRGFESVDEMNETIIKNWNSTVINSDTVYVLGDLMLGGDDGTKKGIELLSSLNGNIHIILGNHDTTNRIEKYMACENVQSIQYANMVKYNGYHFFLTHYPCITSNLFKETLKQSTINLFGHTHSKDKFYLDMPFMYNVALDAHNCYPVSVDEVIFDLNKHFEECKEQL